MDFDFSARIQARIFVTNGADLASETGADFSQPFSSCSKKALRIQATENPQIHANSGKIYRLLWELDPGMHHCFGCQNLFADQPKLVSQPFLFW